MILRILCLLLLFIFCSVTIVYKEMLVTQFKSHVHAPLASVERVNVFFCVPVKSTASMRSLHDTELINTLFPSLSQSIDLHELGGSRYICAHDVLTLYN